MRNGILLVALAGACGSSGPDFCELRGDKALLFDDVTDASGADFVYSTWDFKAGALGVADLDGDGRADIVAARREDMLAVFRNRGGMRFDDVTAASGLDPAVGATAIATSDLDNDGDLDLVLASTGSARILENDGTGHFRVVQELADSGATEQVLPVDLDGDGRLDLYFSNYDLNSATKSTNRVFMNQGGLAFSSGELAGGGWTWTTTAFDFDGDGDQDLYVANDTLLPDFGGPPMMSPRTGDLLLRNDGVDADGLPVFTDVGKAAGLTDPRSSMGGVLEDIDEDGRLDLYVPNLGAKKLFVGDMTQGFVDRAKDLGVLGLVRDIPGCTPDTTDENCLLLSWGAVFTDFDSDGYDELLLTNGEQHKYGRPPVLLFQRTAQTPYHEVSPDIGCLDARGVIATDLDGDGDPDLVMSQKVGPLVIYETRGTPPPQSWLRVHLRGHASNRDGVGAVVMLHMASGRTQQRVIGAGGMINSAGPAEAHFGLGTDEVDMVEVLWPSHAKTQLAHPAAGSTLLLEEPVP